MTSTPARRPSFVPLTTAVLIAWVTSAASAQQTATPPAAPDYGASLATTTSHDGAAVPDGTRCFGPTGDGLDLVPPVSLAAFQDATPQDEAPIPAPAGWQFDYYIAGWAPVKIKGDMVVGSLDTEMDLSLSDLFDDLDFLFSGSFSLRKGPWTFVAGGMYIKLEADTRTEVSGLGDVRTSSTTELTFADLALMYRACDGPLGSSETATWGVDVLGGARLWHLDLDVNARAGGFNPMIDQSNGFVDPLVGLRLVLGLSDRLTVAVRADVGGFEVGSAATWDWSISGIARWDLSPRIDLVAGYRHLRLERDASASSSSQIGLDIYLTGPILGMSIDF